MLFRQSRPTPQTDPELEATFQQILSQFTPDQLQTSQGQLRFFHRASYEAGRQAGKKEVTVQSSTFLCPVCNKTVMTLYPTKVPHQFIQRCDQCEKRHQTLQQEPQSPNPYKLWVDDSQRKQATQDILRRHAGVMLAQKIKLTKDDVPTDTLPSIPPQLAHEIQQANVTVDIVPVPMGEIIIEDQWLLNNIPVEIPIVEVSEGETETGLPALVAHLKHVSKRTA